MPQNTPYSGESQAAFRARQRRQKKEAMVPSAWAEYQKMYPHRMRPGQMNQGSSVVVTIKTPDAGLDPEAKKIMEAKLAAENRVLQSRKEKLVYGQERGHGVSDAEKKARRKLKNQ
jgi:hypothetical protein